MIGTEQAIKEAKTITRHLERLVLQIKCLRISGEIDDKRYVELKIKVYCMHMQMAEGASILKSIK